MPTPPTEVNSTFNQVFNLLIYPFTEEINKPEQLSLFPLNADSLAGKFSQVLVTVSEAGSHLGSSIGLHST